MFWDILVTIHPASKVILLAIWVGYQSDINLGCKALWKESDTSRWVSEAHFWPKTVIVRWAAEDILDCSCQ